MKTRLILISALVLLSFSCRKIIDIELDEADKRTSIDAKLMRGTNDFKVKVSKSGNFFGENTISSITNASVLLDDGTSSYTLTSLGNGYYELPGYNALDNKAYNMKVSVDGTIYEANTTMPAAVELDTVSYLFEPETPFGDEGYRLYVEIDDPAGTENRIEAEFGGERFGGVEDLTMLDDNFVNGNRIVFPLFNMPPAQLGDTVTVFLFSLDKQAHDYFFAIDELLYGDAATPANPKSNWNNNALGNFSALSSDTVTVVIK